MPGVSKAKKRRQIMMRAVRITNGAKKPAISISASRKLQPSTGPPCSVQEAQSSTASSSNAPNPRIKPPVSEAKIKQLVNARQIRESKRALADLKREAASSHLKFARERKSKLFFDYKTIMFILF